MPPRPGLSKGELEVARVVWELKQATVRAVYNQLAHVRDIDFTTVQTYLRRLEEKGYLNVRMEGRVRSYSPKVRPRTVIRETVNDLVDRLFAGNSMPLVRHLVEDNRFTDGEIEQLRELIDRLEGDSDE